jgi:hypothetical protein
VVAKEVDLYGLGRWSYITLRGRNNKFITIITGYRVWISTPKTAGVKTANMQQDRGILQKLCSTEQSSTPNPRHQFILDLQAWLENLVKEGHLLILFMDSNEDLDIYKGNFCPLPYNPGAVTRCEQHDGSMSTLLKTCGLIDVLQTRNSDKAPATYNRGKK